MNADAKMMTNIPVCDDPHHCITCSDEGVPMRIVSCDDDGMLARCVGANGEEIDVLTGLIEDPAIGDTLLVHAGSALLRLAT